MTSPTGWKSIDDQPGHPPERRTRARRSSSPSPAPPARARFAASPVLPPSPSPSPAPAPPPEPEPPREIDPTTYPNLGPLFARRTFPFDSHPRRVPVFDLPSIRSFFRDRDFLPGDTTSTTSTAATTSTPTERELEFYPRLHDRLLRARLGVDVKRRMEFHLLRTGSSGRVAVTVGQRDYNCWTGNGQGQGECGWLDVLQSDVYRPGQPIHLREKTPRVAIQRSRPHSRYMIHLIHYGPQFRPVLYHYPSFESVGSTFDPVADGEEGYEGWFDLRTERGKKCWDLMTDDLISIARSRTSQHPPEFGSGSERAGDSDRAREWGGPGCWNIYAPSLGTPDTPAWTLFGKPAERLPLEPRPTDSRPSHLNPNHPTKPDPHDPQARAYLDVPKLLYQLNNRSKKAKNRRDPVRLGSPLSDRHPRPILNRPPPGTFSPSSRKRHKTTGMGNSIEDRAKDDPQFGAMYRKSIRVRRSEEVSPPRALGANDEDLMEALGDFCKVDTQGHAGDADADDAAKERRIDLLKKVVLRRWSSSGNVQLTTEGGFDLIVHMPLLNPPSSSSTSDAHDHDHGERAQPEPLLFLDLIPPSSEGRRLTDRQEADESFRQKMSRAMTDLRSRSVHHPQHDYLIGCLLHQSRISPILFHLPSGRSVPGKLRRDAAGQSAWESTSLLFPRVLEDCENIVVRAYEDVRLRNYEARLGGSTPLAAQWLLPSHGKIIFPPSAGPGSAGSQVTEQADEIVLEDIAMEAVEEIVSSDTGHASEIIPPQPSHAEQEPERIQYRNVS